MVTSGNLESTFNTGRGLVWIISNLLGLTSVTLELVFLRPTSMRLGLALMRLTSVRLVLTSARLGLFRSLTSVTLGLAFVRLELASLTLGLAFVRLRLALMRLGLTSQDKVLTSGTVIQLMRCC